MGLLRAFAEPVLQLSFAAQGQLDRLLIDDDFQRDRAFDPRVSRAANDGVD
jgi:hypothetical protein